MIEVEKGGKVIISGRILFDPGKGREPPGRGLKFALSVCFADSSPRLAWPFRPLLSARRA
jgi:hypothetical protein